MAPDHNNHTQATIVNHDHPLKIVLLGAAGVGKSTFANRLHSKFFRETYYPTHKSTMLLFDYVPHTEKAHAILDEYGGLLGKHAISEDGDVVLSPVVFQSYNRLTDTAIAQVKKQAKKVHIKNSYYSYTFKGSDCPVPHYHAPATSPISVELIDTPAFRSDMVVPFLEVSLFRNLDPEDLHNLANEPRRPVSTNPLLVASGSGELDGNVSGYIFMYSAVPSLNPPSYDEALTPTTSQSTTTEPQPPSADDISIWKRRDSLPKDDIDGLGVLEVMRGAIFDAWREYRSYQRKWKKGAEGDVYSLVYGLKQLWKMKNIEEEQRKLEQLRAISSQLDHLETDPSSPDSPPPIIIVCTHTKHPGASPLMIEAGKSLAGFWRCGYVECDNETGEGCEEAVALLAREVVERQALQKRLGKKK